MSGGFSSPGFLGSAKDSQEPALWEQASPQPTATTACLGQRARDAVETQLKTTATPQALPSALPGKESSHRGSRVPFAHFAHRLAHLSQGGLPAKTSGTVCSPSPDASAPTLLSLSLSLPGASSEEKPAACPAFAVPLGLNRSLIYLGVLVSKL